jgi:3-oxoacyl-[acyl-carrier-protein] synthase-1
MPLLLCVAEQERPGRLAGLDDQLFRDIEQALGVRFAPASAVIAQGRVSVAIALAQARKLIHEHNAPQVIIAAADSLLSWPTLGVLEREQRLLTEHNSNGFMPGEGGGALLVGRPQGKGEMLCAGIGFGIEKAHIDSGEPLRADGLTAAIKDALADAGCEMHDIDFRITDLSGEQYYFKEAALALSRTLRRGRETFDLWHPAESIGESGAVSGIVCLAIARMASVKGYAPGRGVLMHFANDGGHRVAIAGFGA